MAKYRARHQQFDIILPPLDSLCSIHSALSQVAEALAADMIDPRRAQGLLKALRMAKENLKDSLKDDNAHWHDTPYLTQDATAYDSFEAEYGLPEGIDLSSPPEVAFPPPEPMPMGGAPLSMGGPQLPSFGNCGYDRAPLIPDIPPPYVRDYNAEAEAAMESTPEDIELTEIYNTQGFKAWDRRCKEHQRDSDRKKQRKLFRANYARYAAEAKLKNIQRAAEQLLKKQAAEKAAKPQPVPPPADDTTVSAATRKQPASIDQGSLETAQHQKEAKSIA
jgi:hypothetical protein